MDFFAGNPVAPCNEVQIYKNYIQLTPTAVFEQKLMIYISVIAPYFAIANSRNIYDKEHALSFREHNFNIPHTYNLFKLNQELDNDINKISVKINKHLPDYQRFPVEYAYHTLQDIEFGFSRASYDFNAPHLPLTMTLFNALFTCFI